MSKTPSPTALKSLRYSAPKTNIVYVFVVKILSALLSLLCIRNPKGLDRIPKKGGVVVVSNHISHADPVVLGTVLYRTGRKTRALAKSSLFNVKAVGWFIKNMGHIPVYRDTDQAREALSTAVDAVKNGEIVAVYPEGTVPPSHLWLGPAKTGAARLALLTGAPVVPVAQWGAQKLVPAKNYKAIPKCALRALAKRPVMDIRIGEPFYLSGDANNPADVEKATVQIMAEIAALLRPLRPEPARTDIAA